MENEPVWISARESYSYYLWYNLKSTLMPNEWVSKRFDEGMAKYDKEHDTNISEQEDPDIPG